MTEEGWELLSKPTEYYNQLVEIDGVHADQAFYYAIQV